MHELEGVGYFFADRRMHHARLLYRRQLVFPRCYAGQIGSDICDYSVMMSRGFDAP
jgi:hypothetical protein